MPEKPSSPAIVIRDLKKAFGDIQAVRGVSLEAQRGEILSLLGPNGAGKSTIISMLACLLAPNEGEAWVMGHSILSEQMAVKASIGVVPQEIALYEDLSARENLDFWGKMYGLRGAALAKRIDDVLDVIGLADRQKGRVRKFSGGMKRRLNIGIALLHRPDVLILDEPTVGIDPQSRRNILDSVQGLNREGMTILYTTHYMEEAQQLSDHIAIMDRGEVIAYGTHQELVEIVGELDRIDLTLNLPFIADGETGALLEQWCATEGVHQVSLAARSEDARPSGVEPGREETAADPALGEEVITLLVDDSNVALPGIFESAVDAGVRITSIEIQEPNLEAVFLHLTGRALRDQNVKCDAHGVRSQSFSWPGHLALPLRTGRRRGRFRPLYRPGQTRFKDSRVRRPTRSPAPDRERPSQDRCFGRRARPSPRRRPGPQARVAVWA